jgi:hypothetical protein
MHAGDISTFMAAANMTPLSHRYSFPSYAFKPCNKTHSHGEHKHESKKNVICDESRNTSAWLELRPELRSHGLQSKMDVAAMRHVFVDTQSYFADSYT